jgi:hypothetical protein
VFREYNYTEVFEFKQRSNALKNDIELKKELILSLTKATDTSKEFNQLETLRQKVLEEELQTRLVYMTTLDQLVDVEQLLRKHKEKLRKEHREIAKEEVAKSHYELIKQVKTIIKDKLIEVQHSMYPLVNKLMNEMLFTITERYTELIIDDDGSIVLNQKMVKKLSLKI